jgi:hypothetical protein
MQIDFVKTPYTTRPNMIRNTGPVFVFPPNREIIKAKKQELERYGTDLWAQQPGMESVVKKAAEYCNVYSDNIVDLALRLEEDVAIMHQGKLAAICFCFPSGFKPSEIIGMPLSDIHKPVADGEMLVQASPSISRVMCEQPSFRRWVWSLNMNSDLSNHPSTKRDIKPQSIDDLYFRVETQTTASIDIDTSLFFVKVEVLPLKNIWTEENAQRIKNSINSMSDAVLTYKNLHQVKSLLKLIN